MRYRHSGSCLVFAVVVSVLLSCVARLLNRKLCLRSPCFYSCSSPSSLVCGLRTRPRGVCFVAELVRFFLRRVGLGCAFCAPSSWLLTVPVSVVAKEYCLVLAHARWPLLVPAFSVVSCFITLAIKAFRLSLLNGVALAYPPGSSELDSYAIFSSSVEFPPHAGTVFFQNSL